MLIKSIRTISPWLAAAAFIATTGCGPQTSTTDAASEDTGQVSIAIGEVPSDVRCLNIVASNASRAVERKFDTTPGDSFQQILTGMPTGNVTFNAQAFDGPCNTTDPDVDDPTWIAITVETLVAPNELTYVALIMKRNGRICLEVTFMEEFNCQAVGQRCVSASQCCSGLCRNGACEETNGTTPAPSDAACTLPRETGPCDAAIARWYHDAETGTCKRFIYGGCGGNENNFQTLEECEQTCPPQSTCTLPIVQGPCRAVIPRWAFDAELGECRRFIYGGCGGNANNFQTKTECEGSCKRMAPPCIEPVCNQRIKQGPCDAAISRWAFDRSEQRCVEFLWGGCQPNRNNFVTRAECEGACPNPCSRFRCQSGQVCQVFESTPYCADTCEARDCPDGEVCELVDVVCVRAPCPPVARCTQSSR